MKTAVDRTAQALERARDYLGTLEAKALADTPDGAPVAGKWRVAIAEARDAVLKAELRDAYGHKQGSNETYAQAAAVPLHRRKTALEIMFEGGNLDDERWRAATEIMSVAEMIERTVSIRSASLEARVDNSGAGRDTLIESLGRIRLEITYSAWRAKLAMPRRMYLDMILTCQSLKATARVYGVPWRPARARLMDTLDRWMDIKEAVWRTVDEDDVASVYARLGCGILLPPKPKFVKVEEAEA